MTVNQKPTAPLLEDVSQYDVDFVIPRLGIDLPLGIDPFLMFKSRDEEFRRLHQLITAHFNAGVQSVRLGKLAEAEIILDFPEVAAIGLGYTKSGKRGSGLGGYLRELIIETLNASHGLQERGVLHVEEMQLLAAGIGPDRISDISANILKCHLVEYTQRQAQLWNVPLRKGVPLPHVFDETTMSWVDVYVDLPVSPLDDTPVLFVPRRIVRTLPWINYDDFLQRDFRAYMESRRSAAATERRSKSSTVTRSNKIDVARVTRQDISIVDRYVRTREQHAGEAQPSMEYIDENAKARASALTNRLLTTPAGADAASTYQHLVLEILNFLFSPELIDGKPEVRTIDGTERRDIVFTNDSDETFWTYVRSNHDGILVMFEIKNTEDLEMGAIAQTATYLGSRLGRLGFIVTRKAPTLALMKKTFSVWNDSGTEKKVILVIHDAQLIEMLNIRANDKSPTKWVQTHYRAFRTAAQ
jgi:hypothetical protein